MSKLEEQIKKEENTDAWLSGCAMCDEGVCNFIDKLMEEKKLKQTQAIKVATDLANEKIGADFFNVGSIRQKYNRFKGKITDKPPQKKKEKSVTTVTKPLPESASNDVKEDKDAQTSNPQERLATQLIGSIKAVIQGLQTFNQDDTITSNEDTRQELAFVLVDVIPEVRSALTRINKGD